MKPCVAKRLSKYCVAACIGLLLLSGCASQRAMRGASAPSDPMISLAAYLDRWASWRSLNAELKLSVKTRDTGVSAKGHLIYLNGERYEIGFAKPYNRFLGTFYVTPTQLLYWDTMDSPTIFGLEDTARIDQMIPIMLPNWDPRDLLPFPISGRTAGFQPDSVWTMNGNQYISGSADNVHYQLTFSGKGRVEEETVRRDGRDPVVKRYRRIKMIKGWPVSTSVVCSDTSRESSFKWSLSGVSLDAEEYRRYESKSDSSGLGQPGND